MDGSVGQGHSGSDERTASTEYLPLPGGGRAVYSGAMLAYCRHADRLGSSRLVTTPNRQLYASGLYAPYGQIYEQTGGDVSFTEIA